MWMRHTEERLERNPAMSDIRSRRSSFEVLMRASDCRQPSALDLKVEISIANSNNDFRKIHRVEHNSNLVYFCYLNLHFQIECERLATRLGIFLLHILWKSDEKIGSLNLVHYPTNCSSSRVYVGTLIKKDS